jgi:hypothetical protein
MAKASRKPVDELRPEYKQTDFGALVRGKYARRKAESTNSRRKLAAGSSAPARKRAAR